MKETVAALYVQRGGIYWGREDVDAWDEKRDARKYTGSLPVVAHPPCARWCRLAKFVEKTYGHKVGDDGGCFAAALESVRRCGGVLEHPAHSLAWQKYGLKRPTPGTWVRVGNEWTCQVSQSVYWHAARKMTWLLYVGANEPPELDWSIAQTAKVVGSYSRKPDGSVERRNPNRMHGRVSSATPPEFQALLLSLARNCGGPR